jgi:hypothetical protein
MSDQFTGPDYSTGLPPNVKRHWEVDATEDLLLVIWNTHKKKGITLKTNRPYIVFAQIVAKFVQDIEPAEIREGLSCLSNHGVTIHGNFLIYTAFQDEFLPDDYLHEVDPFIIMREGYDVDNPENNSYKLAQLLDINTPNTPARVVKQPPSKEAMDSFGNGRSRNISNGGEDFTF